MDNSPSPSNFQEPLITKLEQLEEKFNLLVQALEARQLEITSQDFTFARPVFGAKEPTFRCLKIGIQDVVRYFHECPQLLEPYAIVTDLAEATYRGRTHKIILDRQRGDRGKFWVLFVENDHRKKSYLVLPNGNLGHKLGRAINTLEKVFDIDRSNVNSDYLNLVIPAQVQLRSDYSSWELMEDHKGKLDQSTITAVSDIRLELERFLTIQATTKVELEQEIKALGQGQEKTKVYLESLEKYLSNLQEKIKSLDPQVQLTALNHSLRNHDRSVEQLQSSHHQLQEQLQTLQAQFNRSLITKAEPAAHPSINYDGLQQNFRNLYDRLEQVEERVKTLAKKVKTISSQAPNSQLITLEESQNKRLNDLETKLQKISEVVKQLGNATIIKSQQSSPAIATSAPSSLGKLDPLEKLVLLYNRSPHKLKEHYRLWVVKETQESIRRRFDDRHNPAPTDVTFEETDNGIYWLLKEEGQPSYYLTLYNLDNLDLGNNFVKKTVQLLFDCRQAQAVPSKGKLKAKLIKPALVTPISSNPTQWQLTQIGILEFEP